MTNTEPGTSPETWLPRDVVIVIQAARNLASEPFFAERLWEEAEDPRTAALYLIDLLMRERTGLR